MEGPDLTEELQEIWDLAVRESQLAAAMMRKLAPLWAERDAQGAPGHDGDVEDVQAAIALRTTTAVSYSRIRDAHEALTLFPRLFARVEAGELPIEWLRRVIRRSRDLSEEDRADLDRIMGEWEFGVTPETFRRLLAELITWYTSLSELSPVDRAQRRRHVSAPVVEADGTATLTLTGPVPEILSFAQSLDAAAETLQRAQRRALDAGEDDVPFDEDGTVRATGRTMSRGRLRFEALIHGDLNTDGHEVPAPRFAILVTVPFLTLLGRSEAPALLDGVHPLPSDMARELAGESPEWMRILTDPVSGAFLPLPAQRYRPSPQMLMHLRLRGPECSVPGCARPSCRGAEADHIQEFDHRDPVNGGSTSIDNLHLLCWSHHQVKTSRDIDPVRLRDDGGTLGEESPPRRPPAVADRDVLHQSTDPRTGAPRTPAAGDSPGTPVPRAPGRTRWSVREEAHLVAEDAGDLMTPFVVRELETAWQRHLMSAATMEECSSGAACAADSADTDDAPGSVGSTGTDGTVVPVVRTDVPPIPPPF